jgi:hypothetical protein
LVFALFIITKEDIIYEESSFDFHKLCSFSYERETNSADDTELFSDKTSNSSLFMKKISFQGF